MNREIIFILNAIALNKYLNVTTPIINYYLLDIQIAMKIF